MTRPARTLLAATLALLGACGDGLAPTAPECSGLGPPETGLTLAGAREAHRRAALRQRLRLREALEPGYLRRITAPLVEEDALERGLYCAPDLYEVGRLLFEHPFGYADGLAAGRPADGASPFRRVQDGRAGGPETTSCTSCHWRGGPGGAGGYSDAAFLLGDGDRTESGDARNPPALVGAGAVQAVAEEMTAELAARRDEARGRARAGAAVTIELIAKGVSFGMLRVLPDGQLDTDAVRGIDADLVVRPFGWKGTSRTVADFIAEAAAVHIGIQSQGLAAADPAAPADPLVLGGGPVADPDRDGIADELTAGQLTALATHVALLELPIGGPHQRPVDRDDPGGPTEPYLVDEWARGRQILEQLGCASCHLPRLVLDRATVTITAPGARAGATVDLARDAEAPRLTFDPTAGGYPVFAYSDFKRHDLGDAAASQHVHHDLGRRLYLTRRLWGVGASGPYFHDGASPTLDDAIRRHGGEAAFARDAWLAAEPADRTALRVFLTSLRREPRLVVP